MSSAVCFYLDQSRILSSDNELNSKYSSKHYLLLPFFPYFPIFFSLIQPFKSLYCTRIFFLTVTFPCYFWVLINSTQAASKTLKKIETFPQILDPAQKISHGFLVRLQIEADLGVEVSRLKCN